jgi:hypothetical protein
VINTSNILDGSLLILFRVILFTYSVWIVVIDHERTNGLNYQKYTIWGELSTCISLFLLLVCSILKFAKDVLRIDSQLDKIENSLYKWTTFFYQWALLCELTLCFLFWAWIWCLKTDVNIMTWEQIGIKIHWDLIGDIGNYNHSVPLLLLLIDFPVNNIIFSRKILYVAFVINTLYIF